MKPAFLKSPANYRTSTAPETPFLRARQEWDERLGVTVVQAKNWRHAFFVSAILSILLGAALIFLAGQRKVIPILVALDKERGEPVVLGPAERRQASVGGLEVKYFLSQFIRFTRSVPLDQVVIKQNWLRAYALLRKEAAGLLNEMTNSDVASPLKKIGHVIVSVQPVAVVQIPETTSYQARWRETVYSPQGMKLEEYSMVGTFTVEVDPPRDEHVIQENPLGLYIKSFQWNKEL